MLSKNTSIANLTLKGCKIVRCFEFYYEENELPLSIQPPENHCRKTEKVHLKVIFQMLTNQPFLPICTLYSV